MGNCFQVKLSQKFLSDGQDIEKIRRATNLTNQEIVEWQNKFLVE